MFVPDRGIRTHGGISVSCASDLAPVEWGVMADASMDRAGGGGRRLVTLVTGGSTGIGRELAGLAAADGREVVLVARRADRLAEVARELGRRHRVRATALAVDLAAGGAVEELMGELAGRNLEVDFLINNAGFGVSRRFPDVGVGAQQAMIALNAAAVAELCRRCLPAMLERGRGRILNVGSAAAFVPGLGFTVYAATKAFVQHLSEGLAGELRGTGVTVSVLCPGPVDTPFLGSAGIRSLSGIRALTLAQPGAVARAGYRGALRGRATIHPGLLPRLVPLIPRLVPRFVLRRIGAMVGRGFAPGAAA